MNVRNSISGPLPTIMESSIGAAQVASFAAMAEENAKQARRIADWAKGLAKLVGNVEKTQSNGEIPREGSSVDVFPYNTDEPSSEEDRPPIMCVGSGPPVCPMGFTAERSRNISDGTATNASDSEDDSGDKLIKDPPECRQDSTSCVIM